MVEFHKGSPIARYSILDNNKVIWRCAKELIGYKIDIPILENLRIFSITVVHV